MSYVLAVDQGTHSTRAAILSSEGEIISCESVPVRTNRISRERIEQDAAELIGSVETSIRDLLERLPKSISSSIECCGIATQRSSVLCWSLDGETASPVLSWQDRRGSMKITELEAESAEIVRLSGLPLSAHYGASKLNWLRENSPGGYELCFGPLGSYLLFNLCKDRSHLIDHGNAQRMQLLNISELQWSRHLCDLFGFPRALLPECRPVCSEYGFLLDTGIPVTAMNGDQNAAWYASGRPDADSARVNIGSGAFILTSCDQEQEHGALLKTLACSDQDTSEFLLEATVNGAGNSLTWLEKNHNIPKPWMLLNQALTEVRDPPLFLNTIGGLGSPWWRGDLRPGFIDNRGDLTPIEKVAGVAESILFLVMCNLTEIEKHKKIKRLDLSGGVSKSDRICQKLANLCGMEIRRSNDPESTLRGTGWIAAGRPDRWLEPGYDVFEPEAEPALTGRWRRFREQLGSYVEEDVDG